MNGWCTPIDAHLVTAGASHSASTVALRTLQIYVLLLLLLLLLSSVGVNVAN